MKPWLIVTGDLVRTGGMDRANLALAEYLVRRGHETHVVAFNVEQNLLKSERVVFHRVPKPLNSYRLAMPLLSRAGRRVARAISARGGRVVVNGGNCIWPDINWVHYVHRAYEPQVAGSWSRRTVSRLAHHREVAREARAFNVARWLITNSHRTARDVLVAAPQVAWARVAVVYLGTEPDTFGATDAEQRGAARRRLGVEPDRPVVIFVGALSDRRKGFDTVFEAWRELARVSSPPMLLGVGAGAELEAWRRRVSEAGLENSIRLLGFRSDVPDLLAAADLMVAPTRYEAYGLGVHEAICRGVPAIVSRSAGVAERYPPDLAGELLLDNPCDSRELVAKLSVWRGDIEGFRRRVVPFADALRSRSWDDMAAEFVRVVESGEAPTPPRYTSPAGITR